MGGDGFIGSDITKFCLSLRMESPHGVVASYVHGTVRQGLGRIGALVALSSLQGALSDHDLKQATQFGTNLAMHIVAMKPM